jgi:hypothetical protein
MRYFFLVKEEGRARLSTVGSQPYNRPFYKEGVTLFPAFKPK